MFFRLYAAAKAPIFSYVDSNFGRGVVGGPLLSSKDIAHRAAAVAIRILSGEPPGNITTPTVRATTPTLRLARTAALAHQRGSAAAGQHRTVSTAGGVGVYRWEMTALAAAILLQSAMIVWLLLEHRRRQRAEILARKTMSELTHMNRVATVGVLSASLAHEVNQPLAGISARASAAMNWLGGEKPDIETTLAALTQIVDASHRASEIVGSVRAMFKSSRTGGSRSTSTLLSARFSQLHASSCRTTASRPPRSSTPVCRW